MKKKATKNGNTPATQHDLAMLGGHLSSRIDHVEEDVKSLREEMREEFDSQRKVLELILSVVQSLEARAKETKGHDGILKNHEKRITDTEFQIRMMRR
jgi:hypothetical protein